MNQCIPWILRVWKMFENLFCSGNLKEKTIILSSHNQEDISMLCDKTYYMKDGKIIDG